MRKTITIVLTVLALVTGAGAAGLGDNPQTVFSYVGPTAMFSRYGTNDANGFTNSVKYVNVSKSRNVAFEWKLTGFNANASNVLFLVVYPATTSSSRATIGQRIAATPTTTEQIVITNTTPNSPWVAVQLESVGAASGTPTTNVVVKVWNVAP